MTWTSTLAVFDRDATTTARATAAGSTRAGGVHRPGLRGRVRRLHPRRPRPGARELGLGRPPRRLSLPRHTRPAPVPEPAAGSADLPCLPQRQPRWGRPEQAGRLLLLVAFLPGHAALHDVDARGLTGTQVTNRANLTRQYFSKLRSGKIHPSKRVVLALAVALGLDLGQTRLLASALELLARAQQQVRRDRGVLHQPRRARRGRDRPRALPARPAAARACRRCRRPQPRRPPALVRHRDAVASQFTQGPWRPRLVATRGQGQRDRPEERDGGLRAQQKRKSRQARRPRGEDRDVLGLHSGTRRGLAKELVFVVDEQVDNTSSPATPWAASTQRSSGSRGLDTGGERLRRIL